MGYVGYELQRLVQNNPIVFMLYLCVMLSLVAKYIIKWIRPSRGGESPDSNDSVRNINVVPFAPTGENGFWIFGRLVYI